MHLFFTKIKEEILAKPKFPKFSKIGQLVISTYLFFVIVFRKLRATTNKFLKELSLNVIFL